MNFTGIKGHQRQLGFLNTMGHGESIHHAILLTGQSGIGKRLIASRFAKSLYCRAQNSPCLECAVCRQIETGSFPDFIVLERDEKGKIPVGVREKPAPGTVRWLIERITRTPVTGRYCIIIDGVNTISDAGQNALLKTIEEPYSNSVIIMTAEGRSGILPTILSRCVNITFNPLGDDDISGILRENGAKETVIRAVTLMSGGSADCAIRLLDDKVMKYVTDFAGSMSGAIKSGNMSSLAVTDKQQDTGDDFLLRVLINLYSSMLREGGNMAHGGLPASVLCDSADTLKLLKILLAIKKGENNNLNFRNSLKGMLYSFDRIDASASLDPDFSWL